MRPLGMIHGRSGSQMLLLSAVLALAVFVFGHALLQGQPSPCEQQCPFLDCELPSGNCGACGQYHVWFHWEPAGANCIACGEGECYWLEKVNPDWCGICDYSFVQMCLTCIT
jgi:hypothetical protein